MGAKPRKKHVYWASRDRGIYSDYVEIHTARPRWEDQHAAWYVAIKGQYERIICLEEATRLLGFTPEPGTCHPVTITVRRAGEVIRK